MNFDRLLINTIETNSMQVNLDFKEKTLKEKNANAAKVSNIMDLLKIAQELEEGTSSQKQKPRDPKFNSKIEMDEKHAQEQIQTFGIQLREYIKQAEESINSEKEVFFLEPSTDPKKYEKQIKTLTAVQNLFKLIMSDAQKIIDEDQRLDNLIKTIDVQLHRQKTEKELSVRQPPDMDLEFPALEEFPIIVPPNSPSGDNVVRIPEPVVDDGRHFVSDPNYIPPQHGWAGIPTPTIRVPRPQLPPPPPNDRNAHIC